MTPGQFKKMDERDQLTTVYTAGEMIGERTEKYHKIMLYQLHSFYVEVYYHLHFNVVIDIRAFTSTRFLAPYLEAINLEELLCP